MTEPAPPPLATATFPFRRIPPFDPPLWYPTLLADRPERVRMAGGNRAWLVARHADVRRMLQHPHLSADRRRPGFPRFAPDGGSPTPRRPAPPEPAFRTPLNWLDPPEHTAARRRVVDGLTLRRIQALRPRIQQIVDDCLAGMLARGGPADLVRSLALPVPSRVICELLGVPYAGHQVFEASTGTLFAAGTTAAQRARAGRTIRSYLDGVVRRRRPDPAGDLLARLAGTLDHEAVVSTAFVLLVAGHATTASLISLGVLALLRHPGQRELIEAGPGLAPGAVDELVRYLSVVDASTARTATADVEVGGVVIRAGEGVVGYGHAANRDPAVFARPDRLDLRRGGGPHLGFGYGRHLCPGQHLARAEAQAVFDTLFARIPTLRLAVPAGALRFRHGANIYGVDTLPVTW